MRSEECEASAGRARNTISERIARYLEHGDASYVGKASTNELVAQARLSAIETTNAVKQGFESAVHNILNQRVLSREEEARFSKLVDDWNFQQSDLNQKGSWIKLVQSFVIRDLLEGKVPDRCKIQNSTLLLGKNESYVWIFNEPLPGWPSRGAGPLLGTRGKRARKSGHSSTSGGGIKSPV